MVPLGTRACICGWHNHRPRHGLLERRCIAPVVKEADLVWPGRLQRSDAGEHPLDHRRRANRRACDVRQSIRPASREKSRIAHGSVDQARVPPWAARMSVLRRVRAWLVRRCAVMPLSRFPANSRRSAPAAGPPRFACPNRSSPQHARCRGLGSASRSRDCRFNMPHACLMHGAITPTDINRSGAPSASLHCNQRSPICK